MDQDVDVEPYLFDPDLPVEWEMIDQLVVPMNKDPSCPICLGEPCAPRGSKCGHVYCWTCLLRYLDMSDKQWRKCPICFDPIYRDKLKPVLFYRTNPPITCSVQSPAAMDFVLIRRQPGSCVALPTHLELSVPEASNREALAFSRVMVSDTQYHQRLLDEQWDQLQESIQELKQFQTSQDQFSTEYKYYQLCLDQLKRERKTDDKKKMKQKQNVQETQFFYYQSKDGQHIYLHPMDIKVLKHEYGSYSQFPLQVSAPVLSIQESTMDEDLRKRCKYLGHVPLGCDVSFCQLDLSSLVSDATLEHFN
ncbi:hypothetical protein EDD86DRAFT_110730 [Gorgonomyces haynaldii]|nr:hypothetical protein EDD86DRAFT_110730 [Gorgonomyces haynaldii]